MSKFFYGGYVLENTSGMRPYAHSNVARKIVNSLIVARLNDFTECLEANVTTKHQVNSTTAAFTMRFQSND